MVMLDLRIFLKMVPLGFSQVEKLFIESISLNKPVLTNTLNILKILYLLKRMNKKRK